MSATKLVWDALDHDAFIRVGLERGYVNVRGLARFLRGRLKLPLSLAGTISAIQRYNRAAQKAKLGATEKFVRGLRVSTRSQIAVIILRKQPATLALVPRLFETVDWSRGEALHVANAETNIAVYLDQPKLQSVLNLIPKSMIVSVNSGMAEVGIRISPEAYDTPGTLMLLLSPLYAQGINITGLIGATPEMSVFVNRADLPRAHEALMRLE